MEQKPEPLAENLVRELVWAGYFPNATVPQSFIDRIEDSIKLYLELKDKLSDKKIMPSDKANEFIFEVLSCQIFYILIPFKEREAVAASMFQILKDSVKIEGENEQTKDIQVFIAVRKTFSRDDSAFLRYHLFTQIFGTLSSQNFDKVLLNFRKAYDEIKGQLSYPQKERILNHIKRRAPAFFILYDILSEDRGHIRSFASNEERLKERVFEACDKRYRSIKNKVKTAIVRSFIFILFTKAIIALSIEGTFESIVLGAIQWSSILLNTLLPPAIMVVAGLGIRTPGEKNSLLILEDIKKIFFEENPVMTNTLLIRNEPKASRTLKDYIFSLLWTLSIIMAFGIIWLTLDRLNFNILSKFIFMFFIAIISFLSYRIYQTANSYTVAKKPNILTPLFDFFFIPVIRVGRSLTEGIAQINFILIVIDFVIETPFKGLIGFFEQWFLFVAKKREELG